MTAAVLVFCACVLTWVARVIKAAGREQVALFRQERSVSPDDVVADAEAIRLLTGTWTA